MNEINGFDQERITSVGYQYRQPNRTKHVDWYMNIGCSTRGN
jgi:hypothetical protein